MTDNEETRSYNDILKDNEDLTREVENLKAHNRSRVYQSNGIQAVDTELFRHAFVEGIKYQARIGGGTRDILALAYIYLETNLEAAIEAWKAQQDND